MAAFAEAKGVDLEDSNIAGIGSDADAAARKAAAMTDEQWAGAGESAGIEIWRVENRRTEADTPDFGVRRWPRDEFGNFFKGDSYIILKTNVDDESGKLSWDVHFWLGENTTQDEMGVAAYKTVELDDLLDGAPIQYREVEGNESALFMSYFPAVKYLEGGIESGFRSVKPEEYVPRLFHIKKQGKKMRCCQVPCTRDSLNHGDAFVLDGGLKVYLWNGDTANAFEKQRASTVQANMCSERHGKSTKGDSDSDEFWDLLGGRGEVTLEGHCDELVEHTTQFGERLVFQLSDASGEMTFTEVARGQVSRAVLSSADVFILDVQCKVFVWVGREASPAERRSCMRRATDYLVSHEDRPNCTPITRVVEGAREPNDFADVFNADA